MMRRLPTQCMSYFGQVNYRDFPFRERNYGKEVQKYRTIFHRSHPNRLLHHLQELNIRQSKRRQVSFQRGTMGENGDSNAMFDEQCK